MKALIFISFLLLFICGFSTGNDIYFYAIFAEALIIISIAETKEAGKKKEKN